MAEEDKYGYGVVYKPSSESPSPLKSDPEDLKRRGVKYIRLQWVDFINNVRCRLIPIDYFQKLLQSNRPGVGLTHAVLGLVAVHVSPGFSGHGEYLFVPDMDSCRIATYAPNQAVVHGWFQEKHPSPSGDISVPLCPRGLLKRMVDMAKEIGVSFLVGIEHEFILLSETTPKPVAVNPADWSTTAKFPAGAVETLAMEKIVDAIQEAGIEVQMYHAEAAPGQYEIVTGPLNPLEAADAAVFSRETIYNIAAAHGLRATFAPRIYTSSPGSAAHVHISVHSEKKVSENSRKDQAKASTLDPTERSFLQGILSHLPSILPLTMPTQYSYARMLDGIWSGGTYISWGTENRESPIRLSGSRSGGGHHFEVRCIDGTANPFLVFASLIGAGVAAIKEGEELMFKDAGKPVAEMSEEEKAEYGYENAGRLPSSAANARKALDADQGMRKVLGDVFVDKYLSVNETLEKTLVADTEEASLSKLVQWY